MKLYDIKNLNRGDLVRQKDSRHIFEIKSIYHDFAGIKNTFKIFFTDGTFTKDEEYLESLVHCRADGKEIVRIKLPPKPPAPAQSTPREFVIPAFPESIVLTASENPKFKENQEIVYVWGDGYLTDPVNWKRENGVQIARVVFEADDGFVYLDSKRLVHKDRIFANKQNAFTFVFIETRKKMEQFEKLHRELFQEN